MRLAGRVARLEKRLNAAGCSACGANGSVRLEVVVLDDDDPRRDLAAPWPAEGCPACGKGLVYRVVIE